MSTSRQSLTKKIEERARELGLLDGPQALVHARQAMLANALADEKIDLFDEVAATRKQWEKSRQDADDANRKAFIDSMRPGGGLDQLVEVLLSRSGREILREEVNAARDPGAYSATPRGLISKRHQPHDILPQLLAGRSNHEQELLLGSALAAVEVMEKAFYSRELPEHMRSAREKAAGNLAIVAVLGLQGSVEPGDVEKYSKSELLNVAIRRKTYSLSGSIMPRRPPHRLTENLVVDALLAQHFGELAGVDRQKVAVVDGFYRNHRTIQQLLATPDEVFSLDGVPPPSDEAYLQIPEDARALVDASGLLDVPDIVKPAMRHKMVQVWESLDSEAYSQGKLQEISDFVFRQRQDVYARQQEKSRLPVEVWNQMQPGGCLATLREIIEDTEGCRQLLNEISNTKANAKSVEYPISMDAFVHDGNPASLIYQATKDVPRNDMERYSPHLVKTLTHIVSYAPTLLHLIKRMTDNNNPEASSFTPSKLWISTLSEAAQLHQAPAFEAPPTKTEFFFASATKGRLSDNMLSDDGKKIINKVGNFEANRRVFERERETLQEQMQNQQAEEKAVQASPPTPSLFDRLFKRRAPEKADTPTPSGHRPG